MIGLSEKEREILAVVQTDAELPIQRIAELTGFASHSVRYHIGNLQSRGVIGQPLPFINVYRLGYTEYVLYLSLSAEGQTNRQALLEELSQTQAVSWLLQVGSQYQYVVSICALHVQHVAAVLNSVCKQFGNVFAEKEMILRLAFTYYGRRYLSDTNYVPNRLHVGGADELVEVDDIDRKVLSAMAHGEYKSISHLSRLTGIPNTTLERRKRRLEEEHVIDGYTYQLSAEDIGVQQFKLLLGVKGMSPSLTAALFEFCEERSEVIFFVECIGSWDYEFGIEVKSASEVSDTRQALHTQFQNEVLAIHTVPVMSYVKRHSYPFYEN